MNDNDGDNDQAPVRSGGTYRDDKMGHPVGHHGKAGHKGHGKGNRESHGGCKGCGASPCVCKP